MTRDAASERRCAAATDPSTWLSANAGSGKTRVLTDRVARLLLGGVQPQHILCLTYTKAAATEMQNRLFQRLGTWAMLPEQGCGRTAAIGVDGPPTPILAQARRPVRPRDRDAGRAADPDHPLVLRGAPAAVPAGGTGLAPVPGDGGPRGRPDARQVLDRFAAGPEAPAAGGVCAVPHQRRCPRPAARHRPPARGIRAARRRDDLRGCTNWSRMRTPTASGAGAGR